LQPGTVPISSRKQAHGERLFTGGDVTSDERLVLVLDQLTGVADEVAAVAQQRPHHADVFRGTGMPNCERQVSTV
jgi:hypothetical protein